MKASVLLRCALSLAVGSLATGCGGEPLAPAVPEYAPANETKCAVRKSQDQPLIIEWPGNDRVALEASLAKGVVPVRYEGCEMNVLRNCSADAQYSYRGVTRETESVHIEDSSELYANLPLGAVTLEGSLERAGQLDVEMIIAGRYETEHKTIRLDELAGRDCAEATHVIVAVNVGAFELSAGAKLDANAKVDIVGRGGGAKHQGERRKLKSGGDPDKCEAASRKDTEPPEGCSALLRVEVVPLGEAPVATPVCPEGSKWNGVQCVRTQVVTQLRCPEGTRLVGRSCEPLVSKQCPSGTRYKAGRGCVAVGGVSPDSGNEAPPADSAGSSNWVIWGVLGGLAAATTVGIVVGATAEDDPASSGAGDPPIAPGRTGGLDSSPLWAVEF